MDRKRAQVKRLHSLCRRGYTVDNDILRKCFSEIDILNEAMIYGKVIQVLYSEDNYGITVTDHAVIIRTGYFYASPDRHPEIQKDFTLFELVPYGLNRYLMYFFTAPGKWWHVEKPHFTLDQGLSSFFFLYVAGGGNLIFLF